MASAIALCNIYIISLSEEILEPLSVRYDYKFEYIIHKRYIKIRRYLFRKGVFRLYLMPSHMKISYLIVEISF